MSQLQIQSPVPLHKDRRQQYVSQVRITMPKESSPLYRKQPNKRKASLEPSGVLIQKKNLMSVRQPALR